MADPPPLPGCRRLYLYDCPREGLVSAAGMPLAGWGAARVEAFFRHAWCRRARCRRSRWPGAGSADPADYVFTYAAAYFRLAADFSGICLGAGPHPGWLACFALDVPSWLAFPAAAGGLGGPPGRQ